MRIEPERASRSSNAQRSVIPKNPNACQRGAMAVFPQELWQEAFTVTQKENGKAMPGRVGINKDAARSRDHGCFQINDHWQFGHPESMWQDFNSIYDPTFNAKVAYDIYKRNGSTWGPWYSVCSKPPKQVFSNERCGR